MCNSVQSRKMWFQTDDDIPPQMNFLYGYPHSNTLVTFYFRLAVKMHYVGHTAT